MGRESSVGRSVVGVWRDVDRTVVWKTDGFEVGVAVWMETRWLSFVEVVAIVVGGAVFDATVDVRPLVEVV